MKDSSSFSVHVMKTVLVQLQTTTYVWIIGTRQVGEWDSPDSFIKSKTVAQENSFTSWKTFRAHMYKNDEYVLWTNARNHHFTDVSIFVY